MAIIYTQQSYVTFPNYDIDTVPKLMHACINGLGLSVRVWCLGFVHDMAWVSAVGNQLTFNFHLQSKSTFNVCMLSQSFVTFQTRDVIGFVSGSIQWPSFAFNVINLDIQLFTILWYFPNYDIDTVPKLMHAYIKGLGLSVRVWCHLAMTWLGFVPRDYDCDNLCNSIMKPPILSIFINLKA